MPFLTRRNWLKQISGAAAVPSLYKRSSASPVGWQTPVAQPVADFGLTFIGKLAARPSLAITSSPLSLGFETLDRRIFDPTRTYDHLAKLGVKWARCQTGWARTETTKGVYDFAWLDEIVDSLIKIGIKPWFNLGYGNRLYTPAASEYGVGWIPVATLEEREGWLNYVRRIAERFRTRVADWELWNEPNHTSFWRPTTPNPEAYTEFVKITAPEIRRRIPKAVIIGGALAGIPRSLDYLERCFESGIGQYVDKISYHPYRAIPEASYESDLSSLRGLIARYKPGMEVWQGENGAPSQKGLIGALSNLEWNESRQAKWLLRRILTDLKYKLERISYFHTIDQVNIMAGDKLGTNYKGLLSADYTPKPSYFAYQTLCAMFDHETKVGDLLVHYENFVPSTTFASFMRGGTPLYAYWTVTDLQQEYTPRITTISVWGGRAARLTNPVLVDPLTARVYQLTAKVNGGFSVLEDIPLMDYPLIITDKMVAGIR